MSDYINKTLSKIIEELEDGFNSAMKIAMKKSHIDIKKIYKKQEPFRGIKFDKQN